MKYFKNLWFALLVISLLLVGCASNEETTTTQKDSKNEQQQSYTVVDDRGIELTFDKVPEKVVSLLPSNTEILFELGAGDKVIGVTQNDTYPEEVLEIEQVADFETVNAERIVEMNPDIIFASSSNEGQIEQLESTGLKVFVIESALTIEDVYGDIQQIAQVMDVEEQGQQIVETIKSQIAAVQEKTATIETKKKVYFEISPAPEVWSVGSNTFQQELMDAAGIENVFSEQEGWFSVTEEDIINVNPEVILTTVNYAENPEAEILSRAGWSTITAIQNKQVYLIDPDIVNRQGPRIGEAIELMAKTVYPELFK
ncbi:ABC transporter substrate-binding protein [Lysinibacillus telephonicus]|uniref:ABC transporter substrate-binding protein n=1 Tax=Lysinibacillus telephonicus TaxID=1714840 RepID=A0A431UJ17_9BACI|nr:ABC transporter substrate-binding protein [Lysinibacillus telephonicus]RTQ89449.1 ABC transporter substrate-binding protein [Lysinibacillus telephonicus]